MSITKEDIILAENNLITGITTSDIVLLNKILHDDLLFLAPNGETITKQIDLASHERGEMKVEQLIPTIEEINIINNTAIAVLVYETKGTMLGTPIKGKFRYIRVWSLFSDGLKVIGGSCIQLS